MRAIESVLGVAPGLVGAAKADAGGNVLEIAGQLDGESLCAVAAMCKVPLERCAELLDLGELCDFSFTYGQGALYVHHDDEGFVAVVGSATKNPETIMKKLGQVIGAGI
jgi:hypothetical protein